MSNPSLGWQKLQDVFYSLRTCYDTLNWSIESIYSNYEIRISPYATILALSSKYVPYPNVIEIYTISGSKVWSVIYNSRPDDHIIDFAFRGEDLCVVMSNTRFRYYRDFKGTFNEYNFTKDLIKLDGGNENGQSSHFITDLESNQREEIFEVIEIKVKDKYLVLRLRDKFIITDLDSFANYMIPIDLPNIHTFNIITGGDEVTILISHEQTVVSIKVDLPLCTYELIDHQLTDGPFLTIEPSVNGKLIALKLSKIFVVNNDFDQILLEYESDAVSYNVSWCGNDAIVLSLKDEIKLIGPGQQAISFFYDMYEEDDFDIDMILNDKQDDLSYTIPILHSQSDGLKVITSSKVQFLSRVPESSRNLYQIGSSHPSSILLDCVDKFAQHSSKADTNISLLKSENSLEIAINGCLEVVLDEFNHEWQKKVLKGVSFGKTYYEEYSDPAHYLEVINYIKVLNQIRTNDMFLTYNELLEVGWDEFIQMLLKRDQHFLALKIVDMLNLQHFKDVIYIHWCCYKIKKELDMSDIDLLKVVAKKLTSASKDKKNYISVSKISEVAFEEGRNVLCKLLTNLEPSINKKILQLLKFKEVELALIKSFQVGEYDLSKLLLLYLQDTLSISQFFKILNQNESAITDTSSDELKKIGIDVSSQNLFIRGNLIGSFWVEAIGNQSKTLETYYKQEDNKQALSIIRIKSFLKENKKSQRDSYYDEYKSKLVKGINRSSKTTNKLFQRELDILELKKKLGETYLSNFYDLASLIDILTKLITMNQLKTASTIVRDFKIPQETYWHLVLKLYSESSDFERLYQFVVGKVNDLNNLKSPIGFKVFVDAGLLYNAPQDHISVYIKNCKTLRYTERINLFLKNNDTTLAGAEAFKNKDIDVLRQLVETADEENARTILKGYISKLGY